MGNGELFRMYWVLLKYVLGAFSNQAGTIYHHYNTTITTVINLIYYKLCYIRVYIGNDAYNRIFIVACGGPINVMGRFYKICGVWGAFGKLVGCGVKS